MLFSTHTRLKYCYQTFLSPKKNPAPATTPLLLRPTDHWLFLLWEQEGLSPIPSLKSGVVVVHTCGLGEAEGEKAAARACCPSRLTTSVNSRPREALSQHVMGRAGAEGEPASAPPPHVCAHAPPAPQVFEGSWF